METRMYAGLGAAAEADRDVRAASLFTHHRWNKTAGPSREFLPATALFFQGSHAREVFSVEQGLIKLTLMSKDGQELIVGLRSKGSLLGAASVIVQEPHPVAAVTLTHCSLNCLPADIFLRLAKTDEDFGWYLHQVHSREVYQQASHVAALRYLSARQRFERLLLQFFSSISPQEKQASMKLRLPLKHWEIAQLIGITPEHLSRVLKQIKREGVMHEEDGCMIISDVRRLSGHSDDR